MCNQIYKSCFRDLLNYGAYVDFVQDFLVQAQYWHDPLHFDTYVEKSQFIAEVNWLFSTYVSK